MANYVFADFRGAQAPGRLSSKETFASPAPPLSHSDSGVLCPSESGPVAVLQLCEPLLRPLRLRRRFAILIFFQASNIRITETVRNHQPRELELIAFRAFPRSNCTPLRTWAGAPAAPHCNHRLRLEPRCLFLLSAELLNKLILQDAKQREKFHFLFRPLPRLCGLRSRRPQSGQFLPSDGEAGSNPQGRFADDSSRIANERQGCADNGVIEFPEIMTESHVARCDLQHPTC